MVVVARRLAPSLDALQRPLARGSRAADQSVGSLSQVISLRLALAAFVGAGVLGAGCGGEDSAGVLEGIASEDDGPAHVHGLGINPRDGALLIATHGGLYRVAAGEQEAERVGESRQDTMGFTIVGPDHFLGSGHPDAKGFQAGDPPLLGLIESRDGGQTWRPISLRGEADFHVAPLSRREGLWLRREP
jgi:hypothetical protein